MSYGYHEDPVPQVDFGSITITGKDINPPPARYNRIAVGPNRELLFVSLVAETNVVKAIRSILGGGARADINGAGLKIKRPDRPHEMLCVPNRLNRTEALYDCHTQKLDHGLVHAMFVTRAEGFMVTMSDEALWKELGDTRFTTPILREWLPYIKSEFVAQEHLIPASSANCDCGMLTAGVLELDAAVSAGLKARKILIP